MDQRILRILNDFKIALEKADIIVDKLILFGSYAAGNPKEHSDIDVAIISKSFKKMDFIERIETVATAKAKARLFEPIESYAYTEEEFNAKEKGSFAWHEIKQKGVEVKI